MVSRICILILGLLLPFVACAGYLDTFLWKNRLIFLVAPGGSLPKVQQQLATIERRADAILDRDIKVFELYLDEGYLDGRRLSDSEVKELRARLGVKTDDQLLILIGKDGGIKRRSIIGERLKETFLQIDAMPMRRREMDEKKALGLPVTEP